MENHSVSLGRGAIPSVENLTAQISKLTRIIEKAESAKMKLPKLQAKLALVSSPDFEEKRKAQKQEKVKNLLSGFSREELAKILAQTV